MAVKRKKENIDNTATKRLATEDRTNIPYDKETDQDCGNSCINEHEINSSFVEKVTDTKNKLMNDSNAINDSKSPEKKQCKSGNTHVDDSSICSSELSEKKPSQLPSANPSKPLLLRIRSNLLPVFTFTTQSNKTIRDFREDIFAEMIKRNNDISEKNVENIKIVIPLLGQKQLDKLDRTIEEEGIVDRTVVVIDF